MLNPMTRRRRTRSEDVNEEEERGEKIKRGKRSSTIPSVVKG